MTGNNAVDHNQYYVRKINTAFIVFFGAERNIYENDPSRLKYGEKEVKAAASRRSNGRRKENNKRPINF